MRGRERFEVLYSISLSKRQEEGMRRIAAGIIRRVIGFFLQVDLHKQEMRSPIEERGRGCAARGRESLTTASRCPRPWFALQ